MKVLIVNGSQQYRELFLSLGHFLTVDIREADLLCFTGGEDVTPELYGDAAHAYTGYSPRRDAMEQGIFERAFDLKIPMVGICRGAQFLNVMSGGRMYQHVEKHTRSHYLIDIETGETVYVSSTHHQMMMPSEQAIIVATSQLGGSREWFDGNVARKDVSDQDMEAVYYPSTNCLCFQPHPEFYDAEYEGMKNYFQSLLAKYLKIK